LLYEGREKGGDIFSEVLLYSSPVGATTQRKGVEQRLTQDTQTEQPVDSPALPYDPYRVIYRSRRYDVIGAELEVKSGDADVAGVDGETGRDVWNDVEGQTTSDV